MTRLLLVAAFASACVPAACVHVAEDRARRDETVGQASAGEARLSVDDGLAGVRAFGPDGIVLWAGAPTFSATLVVPADAAEGDWTVVTIRNVLADANLAVYRDDGDPVSVSLESELLPTERSWVIDASGPGTYSFVVDTPDGADPTPWRFGVYADVQEDIDRVGDIYQRMNLDPSMRFVIMSGDLTRRGGSEELERFQAELQRLRVPVYATLGNHELGVRDDLFHDYFGRGSFRFRFRGVQFTLLDSASATLAPVVYDWLARWLDEGEDLFHVVLTHIPPLDPIGTRNGGFASRSEAHALVGMLGRGGVDLTIYGHLHSFYAYENGGIPAYITGGGGAVPERLDGIDRHYMTVDVDPRSGAFQAAVVRID
jgi:hypothetical protein